MSSTFKLTLLIKDQELDHVVYLMEEHLNATAVSTTKTPQDETVWICESYFVDCPNNQDVSNILKSLESYANAVEALPTVEELPAEDWVSKVQKDLAPVYAGDFVIHGSHDRDKFLGRSLSLEIDAGQAFGTAHHGTTKGCLLALQTVFKSHKLKSILDLGTGSGILAIAARKLDKSLDITGSDIDKISTEVAIENAKINRVGKTIDFVYAPGLNHERLKSKQPFDLIIANILAQPLIQLAPNIAKSVNKDGVIILSGLLRTQAREVIAHYRNNGFMLQKRFPIDEWMTLILTKNAKSIHLGRGKCFTAHQIVKKLF